MANLDLNLESYEAQTSDFSPIPAGSYICQITDSEAYYSKAGRPNLKVTLTVADGDYIGRKLWCNFCLDAEVGLKILKSLAVAARHPNPNFIRDSEELHGLYAKARVVITKQEGYADKNDVKGFSDADTGTQSFAASSAPSPAAHHAAPQAAAAAASAPKRPWEKTAA